VETPFKCLQAQPSPHPEPSGTITSIRRSRSAADRGLFREVQLLVIHHVRGTRLDPRAFPGCASAHSPLRLMVEKARETGVQAERPISPS
jgi:hypothetical protein